MKRILALDGGGIRGMFSLQVLARIEELFRQERKNPNLLLAEVFDFFAGTSTGAIIATCLAWGMQVKDIEELYVNKGRQMFAKQHWYLRWRAKYRADAIERTFRDIFFEIGAEGRHAARLGTDKIEKTLLVVMRNASTGSPWPVSNNRLALYNNPGLRDCNLNIPLWQLLRASTAAPTYFPPEAIELDGKNFLFVDGGMTPFNNPALIAVLMATLPTYRMNWPAGRERLHVTSIGTCSARATLPKKIAEKIHMLDQIKFIADALIGSVAIEQDLLCRVLGDCRHGDVLDSEIGRLEKPSLFASTEQKFTYARYDQPLSAAGGVPRADDLDNLDLIPFLQEFGREYATKEVKLEDLYPRHH